MLLVAAEACRKEDIFAPLLWQHAKNGGNKREGEEGKEQDSTTGTFSCRQVQITCCEVLSEVNILQMAFFLHCENCFCSSPGSWMQRDTESGCSWRIMLETSRATVQSFFHKTGKLVQIGEKCTLSRSSERYEHLVLFHLQILLLQRVESRNRRNLLMERNLEEHWSMWVTQQGAELTGRASMSEEALGRWKA